jgi:hypothetical protein
MDSAVSVFLNGISGVFAGIAVLYILMKILARAAGRPASPSSSVSPKTD